ncbi:short-chain dehydrogenase [Pseudomonas alcaligenes]|uniref:Short-chain dehydrogenase n=1 Tax=Aquipseudomonas alcaligenes TaxID=43263 RepID=A0ABR7S2Z7_AQUAC|nr:SDR family NAD(P)-dependent oxidoreductase [Pseudomonas alcaligenes]MBC9250951.1 short-chain dehydrogenase [Pseudomonas alcaligenes]
MTHYNLDGRVVAITGSTGELGSAVCKALIDRGAKIALFDMDETAVEAQAIALGNNTRAWQVDVCSMESIEKAMEEAATHFGGIDVAIANAGVTTFEPLISGSPKRFERVIDVNLVGVWRTFRAAVAHVEKRKGYLMAISPLAAFSHSPPHASYTSSKAGVWAMCDSIRLELRHMGVGVGSAHPTLIHTPRMNTTFESPAGNKIWKGNKTKLFKMVSLGPAVNSIVTGIEKRSDMMFIPGENSIMAQSPRVFRKILEAIEFKDHEVAAMVDAGRPEPPK